MPKTRTELESLIQATVESDTDFQSSLASLSDEEKQAKINERKEIEFDKEIGQLNEKVEKLSKAEELAKNYKTRAEKAEIELKGKKESGNDGEMKFSPKDYLALTEAKVSSDDFDEVKDWATYRKVSISEALKDKTLQTVLREKSEQRATDAATATKARR